MYGTVLSLDNLEEVTGADMALMMVRVRNAAHSASNDATRFTPCFASSVRCPGTHQIQKSMSISSWRELHYYAQ
jgi:hypothetical protein